MSRQTENKISLPSSIIILILDSQVTNKITSLLKEIKTIATAQNQISIWIVKEQCKSLYLKLNRTTVSNIVYILNGKSSEFGIT